MRPERALDIVAAAEPAAEAMLWKRQLERDGFCVIRGAVDPATIKALHGDLADRLDKTPFCETGFYGQKTKRFGGLLKRSAHAAALVAHPMILALVDQVLTPWCDRVQLNFTQAIEIHPGQAAQKPHKDEGMWGGPKGEMEYMISCMWPLTPYRAENGATLMFPRTHNGGDRQADPGEPVAVEMEPGDVLVFVGSTLHGAGANVTNAPRAGLVASYCLGWLKPYENQWLVYPPEVARHFSPDVAALAGYQQHRPNLNNYEGRCPSILLGDQPPPEYLAAADELRPEHVAILADYARRAAELAEARS